MSNYKLIKQLAHNYDQKLVATDPRFRYHVSITHSDGSYLFYDSAFAVKHIIGSEEFLVIFTEHHGYHVYSSDDAVVKMYSVRHAIPTGDFS